MKFTKVAATGPIYYAMELCTSCSNGIGNYMVSFTCCGYLFFPALAIQEMILNGHADEEGVDNIKDGFENELYDNDEPIQ